MERLALPNSDNMALLPPQHTMVKQVHRAQGVVMVNSGRRIKRDGCHTKIALIGAARGALAHPTGATASAVAELAWYRSVGPGAKKPPE